MRLSILLVGVLVTGCGDDLTVGADANPPPGAHWLTIMNPGGGRVVSSSSPSGTVDCPAWCEVKRSGVLTLRAEPVEGRRFLEWGGDCAGTGDCTVTMDADRAVWPTFAPPTPVWGSAFGTTEGDPQFVTSASAMAAIAIDPATGDLVVVGWVGGPVVLAGVAYPSLGDEDIWIAKLSSSGLLRWARRIGGPAEDRALAVAVAGDGTIYVTGYFIGTVDFGSGSVTGPGFHDVFVLALASDGTTIWNRVFGAIGRDQGRAVLVNPDGTIALAGTFEETVTIATSMTSAGGEDAWVGKFDASGIPVWSIALGGDGGGTGSICCGDSADALALGKPGTLIVAGGFADTVDFGVSIETAPGVYARDGFVWQISLLDGAPLWVRRIGALGEDAVAAVTRLPNGDIVAALSFMYEFPFGGVAHSSKGIDDIMVARMDGDTGAEKTAFVVGSTSRDEAHGIAFDSSDQTLVMTGFTDEVVEIGDEHLFAFGGAFVGKFGLDGTSRWSRLYGSLLSRARGVTITDDGAIVVVGSFQDTVAFGQQQLLGPWGGFVLALED